MAKHVTSAKLRKLALANEFVWPKRMTQEEADAKAGELFSWYNDNFQPADGHAWLLEFVEKFPAVAMVRPADIPALKLSMPSITHCWIARMISRGANFSTKFKAHLTAALAASVVSGTKQVKSAERSAAMKTRRGKQSNKPAVSVQDLVRAKVRPIIAELEGFRDSFIDNDFKPVKGKTVGSFFPVEFHGMHARMVAKWFQGVLDELRLAFKGTDDQLTEAYSFLKRAQFKRYIAFVEEIVNHALALVDAAKVGRKPRKRKEKTPEQLVAKVKYAIKGFPKKELGCPPSLEPKRIIGAQEVWLFDGKTRKLHRIVAANADGLTVKGSTIVNRDPAESIVKRVRKPKETLKQVIEGGKVILRKLMGSLTTREARSPGRMSKNIAIVRIVTN